MLDIAEASRDGTRSGCILLFSGGRDSTVAALRLATSYPRLVLVTVSTGHLVGLDRVTRRLVELRRCINPATEWYHFEFEGEPETGSERLFTCLPCHAVYLTAGLMVANATAIRDIAFGYTAYQSSWAEQTPAGRAAISRALKATDKRAIFPVVDLASKEEAAAELRAHHLTDVALEQKCLRQQTNSAAESGLLEAELDTWAHNLSDLVQRGAHSKLRLVRTARLEDIKEHAQCLPLI
jgi:hypothetical protein